MNPFGGFFSALSDLFGSDGGSSASTDSWSNGASVDDSSSWSSGSDWNSGFGTTAGEFQVSSESHDPFPASDFSSSTFGTSDW